jgi:hypothetical protein
MTDQKRDPSSGVYPERLRVIIKKVRRFIPDDELISDLQQAARVVGSDTISTRGYDRLGSFNSSTLITRFGSWRSAVLKAGLRPIKIQKPSKRDLLENIIAVWRSMGRQPKLMEMTRRTGEFSRGPYLRQFGSWFNALAELEEYVKYTTPKNGLNIFSPYRADNAGVQYSDNAGVEYSDNVGVQYIEPACGTSPRAPGIRLRMQVMKRDNFKCVLCGSTPATSPGTVLEIDHIVPWAKGGATVLDNLQTLCSECNNGKSDAFE